MRRVKTREEALTIDVAKVDNNRVHYEVDENAGA